MENFKHSKKNIVDFIGNITDLSQFEDSSIEEIYASHVFEHVLQSEVNKTLKGIHRVLVDGGKFYVSVPDMDILCRMFIDPKAPLRVKFHAMRMMFGGQIDKFDIHYFGWNHQFMIDFLSQAGFKKLERVKNLIYLKTQAITHPMVNQLV
jgi:predicted SAM-dependent methyltransferase